MISRIEEMEERYDKVRSVLENLEEDIENFNDSISDLQALQQYLSSGQWQKDYEADELGEFPGGLPRSVLDDDALSDLFQYRDEVFEQVKSAYITYNTLAK